MSNFLLLTAQWADLLLVLSLKGSILLLLVFLCSYCTWLTALVRKRILAFAAAAVLFLPLLSLVVPAVQLPLIPPLDQHIAVSLTAEGSLPLAEENATNGPQKGEAESTVEIAWIAVLMLLPGLLWLAGFLVLSTRYFLSLIRVNKALKGCSEVASNDLKHLLSFYPPGLAKYGVPLVLTCHSTSLAFSAGLFRPRIVLPADHENWQQETRESIFLHELCHCRERDLLQQLPCRLLSWLMWFNPLVWLINWRFSSLQEECCDEFVLNRGVVASSYAESLLMMARRYQRDKVAGVVAMGSPGTFMRRMRSILRDTRHKRRTTMIRTLMAASVVLLVVLGLAAWSPMQSAVPETTQPPVEQEKVRWEEPAVHSPAVEYPEKAKQEDMAGLVEFHLVINENGAITKLAIDSEDPAGYGFGQAIIDAGKGFTLVPASLKGKEFPYKLDMIAAFSTYRHTVRVEKQSIFERRSSYEEYGIERPHIGFKNTSFHSFVVTNSLPGGRYSFMIKVLKDKSVADLEVFEPVLEPSLKRKLENLLLGSIEITRPAMDDGEPVDYNYILNLEFTFKPAEEEPELGEKETFVPELLHRVEPEYPSKARILRKDGIVKLRADISESGYVEKLEVLSEAPDDMGFAESAKEAVRQWKFEPKRKNGKAVPYQTEFNVEFNLLN